MIGNSSSIEWDQFGVLFLYLAVFLTVIIIVIMAPPSSFAVAKKPAKKKSTKKKKDLEAPSDDSESSDDSSSEEESDDDESDDDGKKKKKRKKSSKKKKMSSSKKKGESNKSPNFNKDEDELVSKAFASVSEDNVIGNNQKSWEVWTKILKQYELLQAASPLDHVKAPRTYRQIKLRFLRSIQFYCNKFAAFYKYAEDNVPSGTPDIEAYCMKEAMHAWQQEYGKAFGFERCYLILKDVVKYEAHQDEAPIDLVENGENAGSKVVVIDGADQPPQPPVRNSIGSVMGSKKERPIGAKAAKEQRREGIDSFKTMFGEHGTLVRKQNREIDAYDILSKERHYYITSGNVEMAAKVDKKIAKLVKRQSKELGLDSSDEEVVALPSVTPAVARRVSNAEEFGEDGGGKMPPVVGRNVDAEEDQEDAAGDELPAFDYGSSEAI